MQTSVHRTGIAVATNRGIELAEIDELDASMGSNEPESHASKKPANKWRRVMGIAFGILAGFFWALSGLFVKGVRNAGVDQLQFVRSLLQYLITLPLLTHGKGEVLYDNRTTNVFLLLRGVSGVMSSWTLNYSLLFIPLGDSMAIMKTDVALIGFCACICLKETCTVLEVIITLLNFIGLVLVSRPSVIFGNDQQKAATTDFVVGVLLAFASASFAALVSILTRKLGKDIHYSAFMIHYSWIGLVFSSVSAVSKGTAKIPCTHDLAMTSCSGLAGILGSLFLTLALQREKASYVAVLQTTQILFAFLLQFAFLGYVPLLTSVIGSIIIFFCAVVLTVIRVRS